MHFFSSSDIDAKIKRVISLGVSFCVVTSKVHRKNIVLGIKADGCGRELPWQWDWVALVSWCIVGLFPVN